MNNRVRQRFGAIVSKAIKSNGLSQSDLARKAGVSQAALSMIIAGKRRPTLATVLKVADALGLNINLKDLK